ncbi:mRNA-decapping enzyme subunit 2, partial [Ascosphaera atra]
MFQQCPLMAHWSRSQVELAFDQFLAYKTRVPVRGAILVNDDMDQVVLVKGWKKSSSWTFPRGKINKDEPDLDCAVREVYEETGFDVKESGLVEADTQKDFIELPMREQSMRLYVIWGVSMDTDFAPRTRKEISGIEWYKLSELPTGRKSKVARPDQQNNHAPGKLPPNRFYMVAPFLSALKRKIRTRKKQMYKQGKWAPPAVDAETMVEEEEDALQNQRRRFVAKTPALSDLHEVNTPEDAMAQLKSVLKISTPAPAEQQQPKPELDRSQTLLGILRSASASEATPTPAPPSQPLAATAVPQQPMQQAASTVPPLQGPLPQPTYPGMPTPSYPPYGAPVPAHAPPPVPGVMPMPPYGPGAAPLPTQPHPSYPGPAPQFWQGQQMPYPGPAYPSFPPQPFPPIPPYTAPFPAPAHVAPPAPPQTAGVPPSGPVPQQFPPPPPPQTGASTPGPASLPYQRTGDPEFVLTQQQRGESGFAPAVPAASSLPPPKLTSHSLSLLNVLKGESPKPAAAQPVATVPAAQTAASATVPNQSASSLLDLLKKHPQSAKPQPGPATATATATAVATPSGAAAVEAHPEPGAQVSQVRLDGPTRASPAPSRRHQPRPPTSDGERPESAHRSTPRSQRAPPTAPKGMTGYQGRARWVQEVDKRQSSLSPPKQKITILPRPQQPQRQLQEQNHARS